MQISKKKADALAKAVEGLVAEGRKYLDKGDLNVAAITLKDAADLQTLHGYLRDDRLDIAVRWTNGLDTAAREHIPAAVYYAIMKHA
jgi:hypothetical protein